MNVETLLLEYQRLRSEGLTPIRAWERLQQFYGKERASAGSVRDIGQGWRSLSGKVFEQIVMAEINSQLSHHNLASEMKAAPWPVLPDKVRSALSERLWVRGELTPVEAESYVDIVAYEVDEQGPVRVLSAYSCKVSLRERFQQDFFWAERLRGRGIRFCFITMDNDEVLIKAAQTGGSNSKQVRMATALYDRIHLFCPAEEIRYFRRVLRSMETISNDLEQWLRESRV